MIAFLLFTFSLFSFAYEDPTGGKAFGPWLYEDQVKPMVKEAGETSHLLILAGGLGGSLIAQPYDRKVRDHRREHRTLLMGENEAQTFSNLADGWFQAGVSLAALSFDTPEGVKMSRAILFTAVSNGVLKIAIDRERPDGSDNASWPSGHTSSMFALAGALTGSYGAKAAVPAYSAATLVALARMRENKHWLSDVVAGAFLGTYWARVSYSVPEKNAVTVMPVLIEDGAMILALKSF